MLEGTLYTIVTNEPKEQGRDITIELKSDHAIFAGHFPGLPVLPGVCMLQIVKELSENSVNKKLQLVRADHLKFLQLVNPNENKTLKIGISCSQPIDDSIQIVATISHSATCFKFKGTFKTLN